MLQSSGSVAVGTEVQQGVFPWFSDECRERPTGSVVSSWTRSCRCAVHEEPSMEIGQGIVCFVSIESTQKLLEYMHWSILQKLYLCRCLWRFWCQNQLQCYDYEICVLLYYYCCCCYNYYSKIFPHFAQCSWYITGHTGCSTSNRN